MQTTARITADGDLNTLMVDDIDYQADMKVYLSKKKRYDNQELEWEELDAKGYSLILQHCPPELTAELKNIDSWTDTEDKRSVVMLLKMIRNIAHNVKQRKQSIMSTVENDSELYLKYQESMQSTSGFYKLFNATINTINAQRRTGGISPLGVQESPGVNQGQGRYHRREPSGHERR